MREGHPPTLRALALRHGRALSAIQKTVNQLIELRVLRLNGGPDRVLQPLTFPTWHVRLTGESGRIYEVQIRAPRMSTAIEWAVKDWKDNGLADVDEAQSVSVVRTAPKAVPT